MCISHAVLDLLVFLLFCFPGYKSSWPQLIDANTSTSTIRRPHPAAPCSERVSCSTCRI